MKRIMITGATGLVATQLIVDLLDKDGCFIYAVSRNKSKLEKTYGKNEKIRFLEIDELETIRSENIDIIIHTALARSDNGIELSDSLLHTKGLLEFARKTKVGSFVNISSQSVYGQSLPPFWKETDPVDPNYLYAMSKYSSELLTNSILENSEINHTNIRLSSVAENARFLNVFVKNALMKQPINIQGGMQNVSLMDVRDVSHALIALINKSSVIEFERVYNLGTGKNRKIIELAKDIQRIFEEEYNQKVEVNLQEVDIKMEVGMDSTLFQNTFSRRPKYNYDEIIKSLINYNIESNSLESEYNYITSKIKGGGEYPIAFKVIY